MLGLNDTKSSLVLPPGSRSDTSTSSCLYISRTVDPRTGGVETRHTKYPHLNLHMGNGTAEDPAAEDKQMPR